MPFVGDLCVCHRALPHQPDELMWSWFSGHPHEDFSEGVGVRNPVVLDLISARPVVSVFSGIAFLAKNLTYGKNGH